MSKHVLDRPKVVSNELLRRVVAIQKRSKPQTSSLTLQRRQRGGVVRGRALQYLRIARAERG